MLSVGWATISVQEVIAMTLPCSPVTPWALLAHRLNSLKSTGVSYRSPEGVYCGAGIRAQKVPESRNEPTISFRIS